MPLGPDPKFVYIAENIMFEQIGCKHTEYAHFSGKRRPNTYSVFANEFVPPSSLGPTTPTLTPTPTPTPTIHPSLGRCSRAASEGEMGVRGLKMKTGSDILTLSFSH